jgi:scyllo-inositol 2-dehydrogenase (NADP+)
MSEKIVRAAIVGYGGAFNMGAHHTREMHATNRMKLVAVCDTDPKRTDAAKKDWPGIETFNAVEDLLAWNKFDLAIVILPHNLHACVAIQLSTAGKHVIVEKPMCITVAEATGMIEAAKNAKTMVTVYHNRRHDGDFLTLRSLVDRGAIGQIYNVEMWGGGYGKPGTWWRSIKAVSGGSFYDWGAHYLDWLLNLVKQPIVNVTGFYQQDLVWKDVTNEDHVHAVIRFANNSVADVQFSSIARVGKPRWRVLGTKGAIVSEDEGFRVYGECEGIPMEGYVRNGQGTHPKYYENIAAHILDGAELDVKPEEARRVIAIMETAEKSAKSGVSEPIPFK